MYIAIKDKEKNRILLAISNGDDLFRCSINELINLENTPLIIKGDTIIAFEESNRMTDLLTCDNNFINLDFSEKGIVKEVVPYIFELAKRELDFEDKFKLTDADWGNSCVIIKDNRIFCIYNDFRVREIADFIVGGAINDIVYGGLNATKHLPVIQRIKLAFNLTEKFFRKNIYPILLIDSSNNSYQQIIWECDK